MTRSFLAASVLAALFSARSPAQNQTAPQFTISTVAGNGTAAYSGDGGPATSASINSPLRIAVDSAGNLYLAEGNDNRVRKVAPNGTITTVAGTGVAGFGGDGGAASAALLNAPGAVAVDAAGNLYIGDRNNNRVRKVTPGGTITTVAGNGEAGNTGDGGLATSAALAVGEDIVLDSAGNLFVTIEGGANVVRKVTALTGIITTVAGNYTTGFSGDGGPATSAAMNLPRGLAIDAAGNLFIADQGNNRIRKVAGGVITTVAGNGTPGFAGDGGPALGAELFSPTGIGLDAAGNLYIADQNNNRIRILLAGGTIATVAGNGTAGFSGDEGLALSAELNTPRDAKVLAGSVYVADPGNNRIRLLAPLPPPPSITPGGVVPIYSSVNTIQPGSWISIYGSNLAVAPASWNGDFPALLGGTSVTINGKAAYLWYVSPGQINAQAPDDPTIGIVNVTVKTAGGTATSTVTLAQFGPSFSVFAGGHVAGIILRTDGSGAYGGGTYDILGPTGTSLGFPTVAAKAGDTLELFGVGFGPTNPTVLAGQVYSGVAAATNSVQLLINNIPVLPGFTGIVEAGLYQINVVQLPAGLGTGDVPLLATVGGVQTPTGVVISLQ